MASSLLSNSLRESTYQRSIPEEHLRKTADAIRAILTNPGVTPRALQYAFRRHHDMTVTGYLREVRLERAHRELQDGDSAAGLTVAATARRWGWANPGSFTSAYRRRYGVTPSLTLRG